MIINIKVDWFRFIFQSGTFYHWRCRVTNNNFRKVISPFLFKWLKQTFMEMQWNIQSWSLIIILNLYLHFPSPSQCLCSVLKKPNWQTGVLVGKSQDTKRMFFCPMFGAQSYGEFSSTWPSCPCPYCHYWGGAGLL